MTKASQHIATAEKKSLVMVRALVIMLMGDIACACILIGHTALVCI
jgi:hypothetical protein